MNPERPRLAIARTLAVIVCAATLGCQHGSAPSGPAARDLSPDEQILLALDGYDPMYQIDENGHVTRLRLTWRHLPGLTDEGLAQFKDLQKLRNIGLGGTPVADQGLVHLEKPQSLQWVWLPKKRSPRPGSKG
jgi:hypothetical protein